MAFVLDTAGSFLWPVTISMPSDGGVREEQSFDARFKRLHQSRINEIQQLATERVAAAERGEESSADISDQQVADEILVGWENIEDASGKELRYTKATKKALLEVPMLASTIVEQYFLSLVEEKKRT